MDQIRAQRASSATPVDARVRRVRACRTRRCRVSQFKAGDAVFGATNARFTGGYAEYAVASATLLAKMPQRMGFIEAASVPVVACTAWQMVFEYGAVDATKRVLVLGAAGNVGAYAVQLARRGAREVIATASPADVAYVQGLGAHRVIDARTSEFEKALTDVDVVLDTIGGDAQGRSFAVIKPAASWSLPSPRQTSRKPLAAADGRCSFWSRSHPGAWNRLGH